MNEIENKIQSDRIAICIDFTLEYLVKIREREIDEKPTATNANNYVGEKYSELKSWDFEYTHNVMEQFGYITYKFHDFDPKSIDELHLTQKGLVVYLNGGYRKHLTNEVEKERLNKELVVASKTSITFSKWVSGVSAAIAFFSLIISYFNYNSDSIENKYLKEQVKTQEHKTSLLEREINQQAQHFSNQLDSLTMELQILSKKVNSASDDNFKRKK